jgi:hypothetical protein
MVCNSFENERTPLSLFSCRLLFVPLRSSVKRTSLKLYVGSMTHRSAVKRGTEPFNLKNEMLQKISPKSRAQLPTR